MSDTPYRQNTQIIHAGRRKEWTSGVVNPPVYHASTCVFETLEEFDHAVANPNDGLYYGRRGTPTQWALQEALTQTEPGAVGCRLTSSGVSAIAASLLCVLKPGDHLLMVDTAYEPTRGICQGLLKDMGVSTTYYDPSVGAEIETLLRENTAAVFCESPGSLTFEIQDIPAIAQIAHSHGAAVIMDNTWATGLLFNPFEHGVDISVQALTKYVVGHSDAMLGCIMANEAYWRRAETTVFRLGLCAAPDDAYLALRGLRTLPLRLRQHEKAALEVAEYLQTHPLVDQVMHPALPSFASYDLWKRDFNGASGLFSFTLNMGERAHLPALLNHRAHFKMGFSWGGFESLILPLRFSGIRTATKPNYHGPALRLHIGLEDTADLIDDLAAGLDSFAKAASGA